MTQSGQGPEAGGPQPSLQIRRDGLDPAPELGEVRASTGLRTALNVFGVPVHLVTRYGDVKAVLADHERFSTAQPAGFVMPGAPPLSADEAADPRAGNLLALDPPEHQRLRRMLTGEFTIRRMTRLQPRIAEIVEQQIDELERHGAPADLVSMFALPIPSLVICELLGVPYADREDFQRRSDSLIDVSMPFAQRYRLQRDSHDYMRSLVKQARSHPNDDMLGMLVREHGDKLTDQELTAICGLLLLAGHETTSNMLGLGALALLRHPDQLAAMRDDPDGVSPAIEELLRYLSVLHHSIPRITTADVEICGVIIPAGELVLASLAAANRDPAFFGDPDTLDIHRDAASHIAFGHGVHHCIGAPLARMELRIALPALLRRFPHLALAEDFETVKYHSFHLIYGLQSLAVSW
jgi:cytochrome P450